jgi:hypothetical protein
VPGDCRAFAVVDHQLAHIYVARQEDRQEVRDFLLGIDGVRDVVPPEELQLQHPRSGDWIALAEPDAWFNYYYWLDDRDAPDFASTVDIHRKPGYDPAELFMTSSLRAMGRLIQKKLGFRYRMDVIPLDAGLVGGSHGLLYPPEDSPLIIGPDAPGDMLQFKDYIRGLISGSADQ